MHSQVISGQGTVAVELLEQAKDWQAAGSGADPLDAVIVPVGGGGLCSGIATAVKGRRAVLRLVRMLILIPLYGSRSLPQLQGVRC